MLTTGDRPLVLVSGKNGRGNAQRSSLSGATATLQPIQKHFKRMRERELISCLISWKHARSEYLKGRSDQPAPEVKLP